MRTGIIDLLWTAAALLALSTLTALPADPPEILSHQGRIAISGTNFNGTGYFKFSLVKDAGGAEAILWHHDGTAEGQVMPAGKIAVMVNKGHYTVLLGEAPGMTAIDSIVFSDNDNVSLRIWFSATPGGMPQLLSPDRRITTVGYAMVAKTANSASTADVASSVSDGAITPEMLAPELRAGLGVAALGFMEFVTVGNPGNVADSTGYGAVAEEFKIGKFEVTNAQYAEFLNTVAKTDPNGLFNSEMEDNGRGGITQSGTPGDFTYASRTNMADKPVNHVSFWDACRFCNWLHNGRPIGTQGEGTTEDGAYDLTDATAITNNTVTRQAGAKYFLPNENEWYKAAFHQPAAQGGDSDDYWLYPTASNDPPTVATADTAGNINNATANIANYDFGADWNSQNGNVTTVGSGGPGSASFYGAFDMAGNIWEREETIISTIRRVLRGGWWLIDETDLRSSRRAEDSPTVENANMGFRVASP